MEDKKFDAIIIGSGVGGLFCALELVSKGKKVLVVERQPIPGGVATSFRRKGFSFEAALHIVDSLSCDGEIRKFLDEQGISQKLDFLELKEFGRLIYPEHDLVIEADFEKLKKTLVDNFPQEQGGLEIFFRQINKFYKQFDAFACANLPLWLKLMLSPVLYPEIIRTSSLTVEQFIPRKIKDKKLRAIISTLWGFIGLAPSELCVFYFLMVLRGYWGQRTAYVKGGFSHLFEVMVDRIREAGSEVRFNTSVKSIIVGKDKTARGIVTEGGEEFLAKVIVSNANAIDTLTRLVDDQSVRSYYFKRLSKMRKSLSAIIFYLGLDVPARAVGMEYPLLSINTTYDHEESFRRCAEGDYDNCNFALVDHSQIDAGLAPPGKGTISVMTLANYANWEGLGRQEYENKKKEVSQIVIARLERYLPGVSRHIEVLEVGTPLTIERFACLPQGAIYGFAETVPQASINHLSQQTKVKGLFLSGAWTRPGCGFHGCFVSGRDAASLVLGFLKQR
jgi:prolycopene isomerase